MIPDVPVHWDLGLSTTSQLRSYEDWDVEPNRDPG